MNNLPPRQHRQPHKHQIEIKLPRNNSEKIIVFLGIICIILILLYGCLLILDRQIPPFLTGIIGLALAPLIALIKPDSINNK